jgi:hypothetical protein
MTLYILWSDWMINGKGSGKKQHGLIGVIYQFFLSHEKVGMAGIWLKFQPRTSRIGGPEHCNYTDQASIGISSIAQIQQ